ncbi:helix-turn-helix domain-containing protein [Anaerocolumna chitinilytica]|uniref:AraC family transcriptional regulator n=1 Tax=Anaerocolumna chitinilytica TaxID=1727145 RepID=A0A7M3SAV8_9FIRM|nr:diguanylate cyclase [Anaerocolumna chitinilytica]BCK01726.1 hypothetical protein bsdcttw_47660 [Anaerocolumna chitinilytica]
MKNFYLLTEAINYIEENLCNEFTLEDVAKACHSSLSGLKKLFGYAFHMGLKEYIQKRRITHAAKDILEGSLTITDIALKYQYNSPEVFTRGFFKVWGITPSAFKKQWRFAGIFPRIQFEYDGGMRMSRRKVDISELYDLLSSRNDSYIICFDMVHMMDINREYGHGGGDKAIVECLRRIETLSDDSCLLFRIGGDEFALVTNLQEERAAKELIERILACNGQTVTYNEEEIPVSMYAACTRITGKNLRYSELFQDLDKTIEKAHYL